MRQATFFTACLLVGLAFSAPTSKEDEPLVITQEFFPDEMVVYTGEHEIVKLLVPLNALNFDDDADEDTDDDSSSNDDNITVFFVQADTNDKGEVTTDQGLYVLKNKVAKKLLDNGRDAAAANDDTKTAYFAAKDGIYSYDVVKNEAVKYGTLNDDLIGIAKVNGSDLIYVLTADHVLYKVTEAGTKKEKVDKVINAQQIILDYENNLFYSTSEKEVFALVGDEVKKIEGLPAPAHPTYLNVIKPPFVMDNGVPVVVDSQSYLVYENGTSEVGEIKFDVKPSAYAPEGTILHYYAYNKKIYEYNLLTLILGELMSELRSFLNDKSDTIQSIATRSRTDLRA